MFVEHEIRVSASLAHVEKRLEGLRSTLEGIADLAYREGELLNSRVGPATAVAREVRLDVGPVEVLSSGLGYPLHWTAKSASQLFPEKGVSICLALHPGCFRGLGHYFVSWPPLLLSVLKGLLPQRLALKPLAGIVV